jgi:hypothetical protein
LTWLNFSTSKIADLYTQIREAIRDKVLCLETKGKSFRGKLILPDISQENELKAHPQRDRDFIYILTTTLRKRGKLLELPSV